LHDHLQRHASLLQRLCGVAAGAILHKVADARLLQVTAEKLVALCPAKIGKARPLVREEERLLIVELGGLLVGPGEEGRAR
jgi:hypothetical protein